MRELGFHACRVGMFFLRNITKTHEEVKVILDFLLVR